MVKIPNQEKTDYFILLLLLIFFLQDACGSLGGSAASAVSSHRLNQIAPDRLQKQ